MLHSAIFDKVIIINQEDGSRANPTIICAGSKDENGNQCKSESRITFRTTENQCAIDVSNTEPEDTGTWILTAVTMNNNGQTQVRNIFSKITLCEKNPAHSFSYFTIFRDKCLYYFTN